MKKSALFSIIIPTFNAEAHLKNCLESINKQSYKNVEVIVVDQEGTDSTREIARKYKVKLIKRPAPAFYSPPSISRNIGAKQAKGDFLYHLDSDMTLSKNLLTEAVTTFTKHSDIGALVVHEEDVPKGYWSKCKALERKCYWGNDNIESARIVRSAVFKKVKGYNEKISSGEDFDIHRKYKKVAKVGFCKNVVYHHIGKLSYKKLVTKKFSYGKTANKYFSTSNTSATSLLKEQLLSFAKNYRLFLSHPIVGAGTIVLKFSELLAGGLAMFTTKKMI